MGTGNKEEGESNISKNIIVKSIDEFTSIAEDGGDGSEWIFHIKKASTLVHPFVSHLYLLTPCPSKCFCHCLDASDTGHLVNAALWKFRMWTAEEVRFFSITPVAMVDLNFPTYGSQILCNYNPDITSGH